MFQTFETNIARIPSASPQCMHAYLEVSIQGDICPNIGRIAMKSN